MLSDLLRSVRIADPRSDRVRPEDEGLAGKVAIVTGGDSPLARAVALCLAVNGADIVLAYREDHGGVREAMRRINAQGASALAVCGHIEDPDFASRVAEAAIERLESAEDTLSGHFDDDPRPLKRDTPALLRGSAIARFGEALREALALHRVRLRAMTQGPIWTPVVPCDPDTDMPFNQHQGNTGPCFVFVALRA